jgi:hypothetical protein
MHRIQAQIDPATMEQLRALAHREGVSVAELLRRGADLVLATDAPSRQAERHARARAVIGSFSDGAGVARDHDEHLDEAFGA